MKSLSTMALIALCSLGVFLVTGHRLCTQTRVARSFQYLAFASAAFGAVFLLALTPMLMISLPIGLLTLGLTGAIFGFVAGAVGVWLPRWFAMIFALLSPTIIWIVQ